MKTHDPLCINRLPGWCYCDLITRVRADEGKRIHETLVALENDRDAARAEVAALHLLAQQDANEAFASGRREVLADLRAKVEGLPVRLTDDGVGTSLYVFVKRADVLALIEEAGQ